MTDTPLTKLYYLELFTL